jgi:hypothetical protein
MEARGESSQSLNTQNNKKSQLYTPAKLEDIENVHGWVSSGPGRVGEGRGGEPEQGRPNLA